MATENSNLTLEPDTVENIRHMLLVGLSCYGELMRLEHHAQILKACNVEVPESLVPEDVAGCAATTLRFADVLRLLA